MKANIIGTIDALNPPNGAQFCITTRDGFPQLFYKIETVKLNDGTTEDVLLYHSSCGGGWMGTNERNPEAYLLKPQFYVLKG